MFYLNQAGTSWPKPPAVIRSMSEGLRLNPIELEDKYNQCLKILCEFLNIKHAKELWITSSCTSALHLAISSLQWEQGDKLLTTHFEHHALSRCLQQLAMVKGIQYKQSPYSSEAIFNLEWLEMELKKGGVKLVAISHASNVTGDILPIEAIAKLAQQYGAITLVDGAQTVGVVPIDLSKLKVDFFTFAGHKGPLGPQGIGGLYIRPGVELLVPAASCDLNQANNSLGHCSNTLSFCDTGSVNMAGLMGLTSGLNFLKQKGLKEIRDNQMQITESVLSVLQSLPIKIYGCNSPKYSTSVVSFNPKKILKKKLDSYLKEKHIYISHGYQCAPWAHEAIGNSKEGAFRVSFGCMNKKSDVDIFLRAMEDFFRTFS